MTADPSVSADSSQHPSVAPDASASTDAVVTEPTKPLELLDLEESSKDADDAKRSHQR
jgi:hypothetical protein